MRERRERDRRKIERRERERERRERDIVCAREIHRKKRRDK